MVTDTSVDNICVQLIARGRGILVLCMAPAQDGTLEASQQQRDARTRALAAGVAACIPEDIFTASLLGAEAVLVLSQTCWFFKLLLKEPERRRVRGALQLVCFDYVRKYITKGLACNLYRKQGPYAGPERQRSRMAPDVDAT